MESATGRKGRHVARDSPAAVAPQGAVQVLKDKDAAKRKDDSKGKKLADGKKPNTAVERKNKAKGAKNEKFEKAKGVIIFVQIIIFICLIVYLLICFFNPINSYLSAQNKEIMDRETI